MAASSDNLTPLMRQYRRMKSEIDPDVILMFRLGDFYEMFFEDAQQAAPILGVVLTRRNGYPMCGVPYHAIDTYLAKMVRANRKVAICDQMEDPALAKGIVRREVTRVVTPGTVTEDTVLAADQSAYIVALSEARGTFGAAWLDLSTGAFLAEEHTSPETLAESLRRVRPRECLLSDEADIALEGAAQAAEIGCITRTDAWRYDVEAAHEVLARHFAVASLECFGLENKAAVVSAAGALLEYVRDRLRRPVDHVRTLRLSQPDGFLLLDEATCAHLDLLPVRGRPKDTTLAGVLDATKTPMGSRRLQQWIAQPLCDLAAIRARHDAVEAFTRERAALNDSRALLSGVRDLERLVGKVSLGRATPRDLLAIAASLDAVPALRAALGESEVRSPKSQVGVAMTTHPGPRTSAPGLRTSDSGLGTSDFGPGTSDSPLLSLAESLRPLPEIARRIRTTLVDEPPAVLVDGGVIREGFNAELDELRAMAADGRAWIARYQAEQIERTGIKNLKIKHNSVFGYTIEVSTAQLANVPPDYQRKQTIANGERFVTPELKRYEEQIATARDRSILLEDQYFQELRAAVAAEIPAIQATASAIANLDVFAALADRALALGYTRPEMTDEVILEVRDSRHPVVEQLPDAERFVPNDSLLDGGQNRLVVITGPNMAGKSTYIRQAAMLVVMAQAGSFVPASAARIGLCDRVFTRVGASDDLARGRSTFMVEMQETANILHNATPRSLVVLDEIGRGTSTFDGISIAWAVAEHIHNEVGCRTLFATHYHELTDLAKILPGVKNYCVLVREQRGGIAFLRRIVPGAADKSYGIAVAQLAGLPASVVARSREILANLEESEHGRDGDSTLARPRNHRSTLTKDNRQMLLF